MDKKILITGGAGYIGSHIVKKLLKEGFSILAIDNLSTGFIEPVNILQKKYDHLEFIRGDLGDKQFLKDLFIKHKIDAVMHLAAKIDTNESVREPDLYYRENFANAVGLVEAMSEAGVKKIIFSSTAAVYGQPQYVPVDENHPTKPITPYGQTKLDFEKYLNKVKNLKYVIFRYFNVGGSDTEGSIGKSHIKSEDLLENIMKVLLEKQEFLKIYGDDYPTQDGTAIRDFLHVEDVVAAHILGLDKIDIVSGEIFNLGSEKGFSVKEIINVAINISGKNIKIKKEPRRKGDIAISVASSAKAKEVLGWDPKFSNLNSIIRTDWEWRKNHVFGYNKNINETKI